MPTAPYLREAQAWANQPYQKVTGPRPTTDASTSFSLKPPAAVRSPISAAALQRAVAPCREDGPTPLQVIPSRAPDPPAGRCAGVRGGRFPCRPPDFGPNLPEPRAGGSRCSHRRAHECRCRSHTPSWTSPTTGSQQLAPSLSTSATATGPA